MSGTAPDAASMARARAQGGFSFVELLAALGIMAFGAGVALGLLTVATTTHRRAIDRTSAALLADAAAADAQGELTLRLDASRLEPAAGAAGTYYLRRDARYPGFEDYVYDIALTPLDDEDPAAATAFHLEVLVRWQTSGKQRTATYHTVALRRLTYQDVFGG